MTDYPVKITKALHAIMQKVTYVKKGGYNKFHNYKYAGENDLLEVLRPAMLEAGLVLLPSGVSHSEIDQYGNTFVEVSYTLIHKDGDVWPDKLTAFGCGNDKNKSGGVGDKGTYKALTGANKYFLFKLFQIETGDDPERAEHEVPNLPPADLTPASDQKMADNIGAYADNVADLPRNKNEWTAWADLFKTAIAGCETVSEIDIVWEKGDARLNACKTASPAMHEYLLDYAQGRREILETPTRDTPNTELGAG